MMYIVTIISFAILIICILIFGDNSIFKQTQMKKKSKINFNEFDDVDKIKKQEQKARENMEYEYNVLRRVADEAEEREEDVNKAVEEAKRHLRNFRILDSVELDEQNVAEGNAIVALKENHNDFDAELFKKWSKQIFRCIKSGTEEQLKVVKLFMTEEMYDRLEYQIKQFKKDGLDFITEDLIISECNLLDYSQAMSKEEIKVMIKSRMKEYIIQKDTHRIVRGDSKKLYEKKIVMTFLKRNIKNEEGFIRNCPNCGAETVQTELGRCRYCSTLVFPIRYNWTLIKFETV